MKRFDFRILFGLALFLLGGLMLLEQMGLIKGASSIFWGVTMIGLGSVFLYGFFGDFRRYWWMVIPGLTLVGVGVDSLLPQQLQSWGGIILLAAIGLSFWSIYFVNRRSWWAIIPGGVLVTLAAVNMLDVMDLSVADNGGGVFFLGLGLTFLLVAILPNGGTNNQWAYIPAVVLVLLGAFLGNQAVDGVSTYVWPVSLIMVGAMILFGFFRRRE